VLLRYGDSNERSRAVGERAGDERVLSAMEAPGDAVHVRHCEWFWTGPKCIAASPSQAYAHRLS